MAVRDYTAHRCRAQRRPRFCSDFVRAAAPLRGLPLFVQEYKSSNLRLAESAASAVGSASASAIGVSYGWDYQRVEEKYGCREDE